MGYGRKTKTAAEFLEWTLQLVSCGWVLNKLYQCHKSNNGCKTLTHVVHFTQTQPSITRKDVNKSSKYKVQPSNARISGYFIRPEIHLRVLLATHKCTCSLSTGPMRLLHTEERNRQTTYMPSNKVITAATRMKQNLLFKTVLLKKEISDFRCKHAALFNKFRPKP